MNEPARQVDRPFLLIEPPKTLPLAPAPAAPTTRELPPIPSRDADYTEALRCVAQAYTISVGELMGRGRMKTVAEARNVAYWLLRTQTRKSFPEIGRVMVKDHTSVMKGMDSCEAQREKDPDFRRFTDELAAAVEARLKDGAA